MNELLSAARPSDNQVNWRENANVGLPVKYYGLVPWALGQSEYRSCTTLLAMAGPPLNWALRNLEVLGIFGPHALGTVQQNAGSNFFKDESFLEHFLYSLVN